jgi:hypothetical protein
MEQFFQDNHFYFQADPAISAPACANDTTTSQLLQFLLPDADRDHLHPDGHRQEFDERLHYTVTEANVRSSTPAVGTVRLDEITAACWITNKGGGC